VASTACTNTSSAAASSSPLRAAKASAASTMPCDTASPATVAAVSPQLALRLRHMAPSASIHASP
jgi:hypothetical protein